MRREEIQLPDPPNNDRPGDRWMCGRTDSPCGRGPGGNGRCTMADGCKPKRTWQGRRHQIGIVVIAICIAALGFVAWQPLRATVVKPGELSTPHAQILSGTMDSGRCAACHPQASSWTDWFSSAGGSELQTSLVSGSQTSAGGHAGVTQSDRCLDCHHASMDRSTAKLAHNLPAAVRSELRLASQQRHSSSWKNWLPPEAVNQEDIQCSACHREHRGPNGNLTAMTNDQCQTCHSDRFDSFASSHPAWTDWPYGRGGQIAFNHATHQTKHFPETMKDGLAADFACSHCHDKNHAGELNRSVSYERSCQSCHDQGLRIEAAAGIDWVTLPSLSQPAADELAMDPQGAWPEGATGFYDGRVTPWMALMMRADPSLTDAMAKVPDHDFSKLDGSRRDAVATAAKIAAGHREIIQAISRNGQQVILDRLADSGIETETLRSLLRSLSPQLIEEADRRWFTSSPNDSASAARTSPIRAAKFLMKPDDDLLDGDLLGGDDDLADDSLIGGSDVLDLGSFSDDELAGDPLADPLGMDPLSAAPASSGDGRPSPRFDADRMLPAGGWYRDDLTYAIRYRGNSHEDPVLRATIELASQLAPSDPARQQILENQAVAACVRCHPGAVSQDRPTTWTTQPLVGRRGGFTKFTHSPHLNIAGLSDCLHCHQIDPDFGQGPMGSGDGPQDRSEGGGAGLNLTSAAATTVNAGVGQAIPAHDFLPMQIGDCASCHRPDAAGDACVKCHRYHIDPGLR
ncbi:Doubled CXXCH motif (Paired_CXXCH_1) [Rubripirellula lacrimiformis]|uniref:Doubled CXXCH motif (Paired_CXXCH_1) n=1 Tax=Rubripirellula lacrimiformis TaxID=1930273 RepID=A0A517NG32_9BACT|nr:cytochrome c3 family protein [Rubripirellula lacrimiformis]QDT06071.1 Doubled CXXCH motif (Paired_CXXCH_1) [Rubripirellula lacrimiformis]